jgi:hypothetical protein
MLDLDRVPALHALTRVTVRAERLGADLAHKVSTFALSRSPKFN